MRQWIGAVALLLAICAIAAFVVVSALSVAEASFRSRTAFDGGDDGPYVYSMRPSDPLETIPCY
jgi:hypothetical protein